MKMKNKIYYNNNDIGTFFVSTFGGFLSFVLFTFLKKNSINSQPNKKEILFLAIIYTAIVIKNIDRFRWFKSQHIITEITIKKTFSHDTRKLNTNFHFDKDNNIKIYNSQSGDIILYVVSSTDEMFTVSKKIAPYFLAISDPGKKIKIEAWKYLHDKEPPYEIYKILKKLKNE
jgi:hypothetical protein